MFKKIQPVLKWVGGKTQILNKLLSLFPSEIDTYYEPFIGGCSVLLGLLQSNIQVNRCIVSDINESLVWLYKNIQSHPLIFIEECDNLIKEFKLESTDQEDFYYTIRTEFNLINDKKSIRNSVLFLFLNKTGFRGLYRVSKNGFNVPFGHNKNPEIMNKEHILQFSELIKNVEFRCCSYTDVLLHLRDNDFIYLDPPYTQENKTSFVSYDDNVFSDQLFYDNLLKMRTKFLASNSSVFNKFNLNSFIIEYVLCKRKINSKNPNAMTNEILITNFIEF